MNPIKNRGFEFYFSFLMSLALFNIFCWEALTTLSFGDEASYYMPHLWTTFKMGIWPKEGLWVPEAIHTPLYPWASAALLNITGWKLSIVREISFSAAALCISAVYLLMRLRSERYFAASIALVCAFIPVVLSQAGMFQPDLPATALVLWGLYFFLTDRMSVASWIFAAAIMTNSTALFVAPLFFSVEKPTLKRNLVFFAPGFILSMAWLTYFLFPPQLWELFPAWLVKDTVHLVGRSSVVQVFQMRIGQFFLTDGRLILVFIGLLSFGFLFSSEYGKDRKLREFVLRLWLTVALQLVALSLFGVGQQRYLLTSTFAITMLAGMGVLWLFEKTSMQKRRFSLAVTTLLFCALIFSRWEYQIWQGPPNQFSSGQENRSGYMASVHSIKKIVDDLRSRPTPATIITNFVFINQLTLPCLGFTDVPLKAVYLFENSNVVDLLKNIQGPMIFAWHTYTEQWAESKRFFALVNLSSCKEEFDGYKVCDVSPKTAQKSTASDSSTN